jgi:hypothetical protein
MSATAKSFDLKSAHSTSSATPLPDNTSTSASLPNNTSTSTALPTSVPTPLFDHRKHFPKAFHAYNDECPNRMKRQYCSYEEYEKTGIWCMPCYHSWTFSDYHSRLLDVGLGWEPGTLNIIDCYGIYGSEGCGFSIQNKWETHCVRCGGDPDKVLTSNTRYQQPTKFNVLKDPPNKIWSCNGHKCRYQTCYSETGIWCTSCRGLFAHSQTFMALLEQRFKDGDTASSVLDDIDLSTDRLL